MVNARDSAAVLRRALELGLRQVWIGPHTARQLGAEPAGWIAAALRGGWLVGPAGDRGAWFELYREGGTERLEFAFPGQDERNPFRTASSPAELLEALELYASHLRLRYRWSPGASGLALMRAVHSGHGGTQLDKDPKLPPPALQPPAGTAESALGELPASGWIHAYDLNAQYLAACSSLELGFGDVAHERPNTAAPAPERLGPGYYRAAIEPPDELVLPFKTGAGAYHWYPAPALELARELRLEVRILEAYTYAESHRWLAPWYERLRDTRAALAAAEGPAALLALGAVKATYTWSLGRLAGGWLEPGDATFRPDWRHAIIARARANMHRHLVRVYRTSRAVPVGRNADAVLYASDLADPIAAAAQLGLELSAQLGKWKPAGSLSASDARKAAAGHKSPLRRLRGVLDALEPLQ